MVGSLRKKKARLISISLVVSIVIGFSIGFFLSAENTYSSEKILVSSSTITMSGSITVTVTRAPRYLSVEVSPMAFPVVGQSWTIFVYSQNSSSDIPVYRPLENATVIIKVKTANSTDIYSYNSNEIGQVQFPCLAQYRDIAFQAEFSGNQSNTVSISEHYDSPETVANLIMLTGVCSPIAGFGSALTFFGKGLSINSKKIRVAIALLIASLSVIFVFVLFFSVYSALFLGTVWGYPEKINDFISLTLLSNIAFLGFVIFLIIAVIIVIMSLHNFVKGKSLNKKNRGIKTS